MPRSQAPSHFPWATILLSSSRIFLVNSRRGFNIIATQLTKFALIKHLIGLFLEVHQTLEKRLANLSKEPKIRKVIVEHHPQRNQKIKLIKSLAILLDAELPIQSSCPQETCHDEKSSNICPSVLAEAKRG